MERTKKITTHPVNVCVCLYIVHGFFCFVWSTSTWKHYLVQQDVHSHIVAVPRSYVRRSVHEPQSQNTGSVSTRLASNDEKQPFNQHARGQNTLKTSVLWKCLYRVFIDTEDEDRAFQSKSATDKLQLNSGNFTNFPRYYECVVIFKLRNNVEHHFNLHLSDWP